MRIAVQGCSHGELDKIYESIVQSEQDTGRKVDILICCGDFQACRNEYDMRSMKVPKKHARIASFWKYYSGKSVPPCLTIVIGGNHEASNYMWELYYGGWLAPKIYYLGCAGVVNVAGLRIGGLSGIYKKFDYHKGHHEVPPLSAPEIVSIFHVRSLEVMRCKSIQRPLDVFLSHDWPLGVYEYGDKEQLLRNKPFFGEDILNNELGSPPAAEILEALQPCYWFSGHLHVKFSAIVPHDKFGKCTRFLALDKCLPKRRFLQILDIGKELSSPPVLEYDPEWLAILAETAKYYNPLNFDQKLPQCAQVSEERIEAVAKQFGSMIIPENFIRTVPVYGEQVGEERCYPSPNPQSQIFCDKLGIKNEVVPDGGKVVTGHDELNLTHDSDANMSLNNSYRVAALESSAINFINDDTPNQVNSSDDKMFRDFSAPEIRTPSSVKADRRVPAKCSTPVVLKRRLTLPPPKNSPQISPIKNVYSSGNSAAGISVNESESETGSGSIKKTICLPEITSPVETESATGLLPPGTEPIPEKSVIENKSFTETDRTAPKTQSDDQTQPDDQTIGDDFDLDETDDDLIAKFLSLKKKFGRAEQSLSDSLLVNTSMRDAVIEDHKSDDKMNEESTNKKFKMEIHNDLDSAN